MDAYRSFDALVAFNEDKRVTAWNGAAELLTGIPAEDALGRTCSELLGVEDERGALVCHPDCSCFRIAREGRSASSRVVSIRTVRGRRRVMMATVAAAGTYLHLLLEPPEAIEDDQLVNGQLTARQREILQQIAAGRPAKVIAHEFGIAEVTVRNHIRAILLVLDSHSQLQAVAEARRRRIVA